MNLFNIITQYYYNYSYYIYLYNTNNIDDYEYIVAV